MKRYNNVITIYDSNHDANTKANVYQTQGLGTLPDATTALVENEFQQALILNMQYPINGHNADLLQEERIIQTQISADKTQLLRIYEVKKSLSGLHYEVKAEPIFNTLRKHFITKLVRDDQHSIDSAWNLALQTATPKIDPTIYKLIVNQDATNSLAKINFEAGNMLQFIAGKEGSLLDYRNPLEFEKDNSTLIVGRKLGKEHAFTATYTRNLTGLDYTVNTQGVVTSYYPFAKVKVEGEEEETLIELNPKVIILDSAKLYTGITKTLDFSQDETVTDVASLQKAYDTYFKANEAERTPQVTVKIDVVSLRNQQGYENFISWQSINVGDSVDVIHGEWNMTLTARVLKYEYDVLTDRYNSVEIGDAKKNFIDNINDNINGSTSNIMDEIQDIIDNMPNKGETQELLDEMVDKITGHAGGNIVLDPPTRPERLLVMDTDNINTAKNIIMLNNAGIVMGKDGINGEFTSAWSIDGIFNAKWIQTGILSGNNLRINLDTGEVTFQKGMIRNSDSTFAIDVTSGEIASRGMYPAPSGTAGREILAGYDLTHGKILFRAGTWGDASVSYGGIVTNPRSGMYFTPDGKIGGGGWFSGSAPALTLQMGDPVPDQWQSFKRAVLMSSTDYVELNALELSGTSKLGYGKIYSDSSWGQTMRGGGIGVAQQYSSSPDVAVDELGEQLTQAWVMARHGVTLASGYAYATTINNSSMMNLYPSIQLGTTWVGKNPTELDKQMASTTQINGGYTVNLAAKNIDLRGGMQGIITIRGMETQIQGGGEYSSGGATFGVNKDGIKGFIKMSTIYNTRTSGSANVVVKSDGTMASVSSALKYKTDVVTDYSAIDSCDKILEVSPKTWIDKEEKETGNIKGRYHGFIADELDELGLTEVVTYDENGEVDGINYDRLSIYIVPLLKKMDARIKQLENSNKG